MCFAIVPKDGKTEVEEVPAEVAELLKEFPDIVSDNVPNGSPPVRKISHQMDLIPGASLPNKAAHRMTPAESEELNRQKHPCPYRIAWVQDDHKVMVNDQCLVKFKIEIGRASCRERV